uniref:Uncharacterized protein n=1 Tax=Romanomermis culicivorax TaxID=13658 RepID=A0A915JHY9_ROMCU
MNEPDYKTEKIPPKWEHMFSEDNRESDLKDQEAQKIEQMHLNLLKRFRILTDQNPDDGTPLYLELKSED